MGRHSSPEQGHFYRSFAGWIVVWAVIAGVAGIAVWFLVAELGGPDVTRPIAQGKDRVRAEAPEPEPEPTVSGARVAAVSTPPASPPAPTPMPTPSQEVELITEGISVQVLNATSDGSAGQTMADRLSELGYEVVAVEESSQPYELTTVFWSTDASREAATAVAERHGWVAEPKPANLSPEVSLHVVVGADEV